MIENRRKAKKKLSSLGEPPFSWQDKLKKLSPDFVFEATLNLYVENDYGDDAEVFDVTVEGFNPFSMTPTPDGLSAIREAIKERKKNGKDSGAVL